MATSQGSVRDVSGIALIVTLSQQGLHQMFDCFAHVLSSASRHQRTTMFMTRKDIYEENEKRL